MTDVQIQQADTVVLSARVEIDPSLGIGTTATDIACEALAAALGRVLRDNEAIP